MGKIDNTIQIGRCLQEILSNDATILSIVGQAPNKIFGMKMPTELIFPFVHYERTGLMPTYTKDNRAQISGWTDTVWFSIGCCSDKYEQSIDLANAVRHAVEGYYWHEAGFMWFDPIEIVNVLEYEASGMFVQEIQIKIEAQPC